MNDKAYKFSTRDDTTFMVDGGGTGSGFMMVNIEYGEPEEAGDEPPQILNKTWQEIHDAIAADVPVFMKFVYPEGSGFIGAGMTLINDVKYNGEGYTVTADSLDYGTSTADGYPTYNGGK